jgi:large subunit ribosomal protein L35
MPKQKTHRASAKRFSFTKTGKVKRACAYKSHILTKKTTKRTRKLRKGAYAHATNARIIRKLVPYK